jgi:hypothetical protein
VVDDEDHARVSAFTWSVKRGPHFIIYAHRSIVTDNGKQSSQMMHRFIMGITDREIPIDHIDGDGLNNRRNNLRICTALENSFNRRKIRPKSSQFKGVSFVKRSGNWIARLGKGGEVYLGKFNSAEDAARAYNSAAAKHFGSFANFNPIEGPPVPKNR